MRDGVMARYERDVVQSPKVWSVKARQSAKEGRRDSEGQ